MRGSLTDEISSELWGKTFEAIPHPLVFARSDERVININEAASRLLNLPKNRVIGKYWNDVVQLLPYGISQLLRFHKTRLEVDDVVLISLRDSREELYLQRVLSFFANTLKSLDGPPDIALKAEESLKEAAQVAVRDICDWCRIDLIPELNVGPGVSAHMDPVMTYLLQEYVSIKPENPDAMLNPLRVIRSGFAVFRGLVDVETLKSSISSHRALHLLQHLGFASYICVPIRRGLTTIGSLTLVRSGKRTPFDSMDLLMAEEYSNKVGINLEKALLYKRLEELKNEAEAANRAKTHFLANVSHEIRTPLGAVLGFADLLIAAPSAQLDRTDWADRIRTNGGHLLRLIDDILDLSKVEVGHLDIKIEKVDLQNLLHNVHASICDKAQSKGLCLELVIEGSLPRYIATDETRLSQVLINVLGNAVKFTPSGFVRMKMARQFPRENRIIFEIQDSGVGIAADQTSLLFQPFSQVDMSRTRQFGGTGLGLALSRGLARHLGGDLVLKESDVNAGSTFVLTITAEPIEEAEFKTIDSSTLSPEAQEEDLSQVLRGRKILVVEDSSDIQALLKRTLEDAGAVTILASNGEEGVQAALTDSFDVILMDVQMPIKDGCQAVQELRALGYKGLVIALTANAMLEEQTRCLSSGFDVHMSKPMRRRDLIQQLGRLTAPQTT
ncbi:hypothetical protein AZI86_01805 [Bdellovibrio bacteriovorus]|uniref:histidine kinase n=1 Tax=Bdellovibrio bacteriovorus TaxID=959 RepID=A0A150WMV4_BDEBC|nr:ATP-binding protein [Bdellovibrio bacteriovorus]KYG65833.1 hypothetical protein AZI86_01805 [Bdellovibrio bacteriovorus]